MNINRIYTITLCLCLLVLMTSVCYAVNIEDFAFYADDGTLQYDFDAYHYRLACDYVAESGYDLEPDNYWLISPVSGDYIGYDWDSFCNDYDDLLSTNVSNEIIESSVAPTEEEDTFDLSDVGSDGPVSVVLEDSQFNTLVELETDFPHQYVIDDRREPPLGSGYFSFNYLTDVPLWQDNSLGYILVSRVVLSDEQFFSSTCVVSGDLYDGAPASGLDGFRDFGGFVGDDFLACAPLILVRNAPISIDLSRFGFSGTGFFPENGIYILHPLWASMTGFDFLSISVPDFYGFPVVDGGETNLDGTLKNLVTSIFGKYEPVMSTDIIMETADNVTTTTLIDVVASGAAGVDWEWCAGVLLFGIMLYCLFKLLGGILS